MITALSTCIIPELNFWIDKKYKSNDGASCNRHPSLFFFMASAFLAFISISLCFFIAFAIMLSFEFFSFHFLGNAFLYEISPSLYILENPCLLIFNLKNSMRCIYIIFSDTSMIQGNATLYTEGKEYRGCSLCGWRNNFLKDIRTDIYSVMDEKNKKRACSAAGSEQTQILLCVPSF